MYVLNFFFCPPFPFSLLPTKTYLSGPPCFPTPSLHLSPCSHSGLNLAPVARLRSSWEKLPSKYEKLFGDLQDLFDPSRNMAKYRNVLSSQSMQPPIIPLFPVVKKDLTFLHEGKWLCGEHVPFFLHICFTHVASFPLCILTRPFPKADMSLCSVWCSLLPLCCEEGQLQAHSGGLLLLKTSHLGFLTYFTESGRNYQNWLLREGFVFNNCL